MTFSNEFRMRKDMVNGAVWMPLNPRDEVLLQRKDGGHLRWPNSWGMFGGQVEPGEEDLVTLSRESEEELGKRVKFLTKPKFFMSHIVNEGQGRLNRQANVGYFGIRFDGDLSNIQLKEGAGFSVFDYETMMKYGDSGLIVPPNYEALKRFYDALREGTFTLD